MTDTNVAGEGNSGMSNDEGGASSDVGRDISFSLRNEHWTVGSEQSSSMRISRKTTSDDSSKQPAPPESNRQGKSLGSVGIVVVACHF
jgi:hypothetical protein